ncbi:MAG: GTP-binding protein, partial [Wolbachia endosymbiont of Hylaeus sinuatus]|nr:GTP-binding protein [Wolbachia endosymbiont of Hylaeus sinuatus]
MNEFKSIRNIAIIAHVDHGKTTLLDNMLKQSGTFRENQEVQERVMDSGDQERERGITILAKCTSIMWGDEKINIIDTPGHADFGGEVERVLCMADGVLLLVDAAEGPMPQTKFVLSKALKANLKPIVIINKVDRPDSRIDEVLNEIYELFFNLDATNEQLDFPVLYASGRNGWCAKELSDERKDLSPLFSTVIDYIKPSVYNQNAPFAMLVTLLESDKFLGRILTGKVYQGIAKVNSDLKVLDLDGKVIERGRLTKLLSFSGLKRIPVEQAV